MNNLNDYFTEHYDNLVKYASKFTQDPNDLVHHIYIKAVNAGFKFVNKPMTDWYFKLGIKQSSYSDFKKLYNNDHLELIDDMYAQEVPDIEKRVMIEMIDEQIRFLTEFDRTVIEIYLRGENMKELSRETDIPYQTIQSSLKRSIAAIKVKIALRLEDDI